MGGSVTVVVRIECTAADAELATDVLWQAGTTAVAEEPVGTARGIAAAAAGPGEGDRVELTAEVAPDELAGLRAWCARTGGAATLEVVDVDPAWADAWAEHAQAYRVGRLVVRPVWVPAEVAPGELDVALDPGPTFGSGSHPSTRGVLGALEEVAPAASRVLDVGSGSGVLSVAALLLGAAEAVGVDIDPAAGPAGRAAATLAGVDRRFAFVEGGPEVAGGEYDLVLANMLIGAIEGVGPDMRSRCAPGATVVMAGFLTSQRDRALAAIGGGEVVRESVEDDWVTLSVRVG